MATNINSGEPISVDPKASVQFVNITDNDLKFQTPCIICVTGSSMCGKTEFMIKLMKFRHQLFKDDFDEILYCSPENMYLRYDPVVERIKNVCPNVRFISGLPNIEKLHLNLDTRSKLIFLDDLQESIVKSAEMITLAIAEKHHSRITLVASFQNFFVQSPRFGRTFFRQVDYRIIFYNRLDQTELRSICSQMNRSPQFLIESFEFLLQTFPNEPAYILIDGHSQSPLKNLFVRSLIFPNENGEIKPIFFFPKA